MINEYFRLDQLKKLPAFMELTNYDFKIILRLRNYEPKKFTPIIPIVHPPLQPGKMAAVESIAHKQERAADAKRITDLERQVRELEGILRKRNPNLLPVSWAPSSGQLPPAKAATVEYLESQVRKLEKQLEERDEDDKRDLRVLEQKFNAMKVRATFSCRSARKSIQKKSSIRKWNYF